MMITCVSCYSQRDNTLHVVLCRTTIHATHVMHISYACMSPVSDRSSEYTECRECMSAMHVCRQCPGGRRMATGSWCW